MIAVRAFSIAVVTCIVAFAPAAARAECRGGAVSGVPSCTWESGGYSEPSALALWIQQKIQEHDERAYQYDALLNRMRDAKARGDLYEFNRLGQQARGIFDRRDLRRWIDEVNFYHWADLAYASAKGGRYEEALRYANSVKDILPARERGWFKEFTAYNQAGIVLAQADDTSRSRKERLALYEDVKRIDPTAYTKGDLAFIEWLRAGVLLDDGRKKEALKRYRAVLSMEGNDTLDHRAVIADLQAELAPPVETTQLNKGALTSDADAVTKTKKRGAPADGKGAKGQLKNATGGQQSGGQTFDGGGGLEADPMVVVAVSDINAARVFTDQELARYNKSTEFKKANADVDTAARLGKAAIEHRQTLVASQKEAKNDADRQRLQIQIQEAEREVSLRRSEKLLAEQARDVAIKRVEQGDYIMVDD